MKDFKKQIAITALSAVACSLTFVGIFSAIQTEPPAKLPEELKPTWRTETVAPLPEEAYPEPVDKPEPVAVVEPETISLGEFKLTAYCTCEKCCGEWADGITYTGTQATAGRTVAVDPDVIPLGSKVLIDGHEYVAEDIGGSIKDNRIDVLLPTHGAAIEFGVKYADVSILK